MNFLRIEIHMRKKTVTKITSMDKSGEEAQGSGGGGSTSWCLSFGPGH